MLSSIRVDKNQNTGDELVEFSMRTAIHRTSRVSSEDKTRHKIFQPLTKNDRGDRV